MTLSSDNFTNKFTSSPHTPRLIVCLPAPHISEVEWYLLADSGKGEAYKGTGQILCVHLISHSFKVILLPCVLFNLRREKQGWKCCMWRWRRKKKQPTLLSNSSPMWFADDPLQNISLVIRCWSIIFMTWEQFFDRSKHLFNVKPQKRWTDFSWQVTIKYDVPKWLETVMEVFLRTKMSEFPKECSVW